MFVGPESASAAASDSGASSTSIAVAVQGVATGNTVSFSESSLFESAADQRIEVRAVDASFASFEEDLLLLTRPSVMRLNPETAELTSRILDSRQPSDMVELNWDDALLEILDEVLV